MGSLEECLRSEADECPFQWRKLAEKAAHRRSSGQIGVQIRTTYGKPN